MIDSALGWIGQIASWIGQWIPRWVVLDTTEGAVKYVRGSRIVVCHPGGIHWYWPAVTVWHQYPTARQADRLETQTMETVDDKTIIVGGLLVYQVIDLRALLTTTFEPSTAIKDIALSAVHDVCCQLEWEPLKNEQRRGTLDTKLRNAAQKQLNEYGVKVIKLMLTTLAKTRVLKVSQSISQEEN